MKIIIDTHSLISAVKNITTKKDTPVGNQQGKSIPADRVTISPEAVNAFLKVYNQINSTRKNQNMELEVGPIKYKGVEPKPSVKIYNAFGRFVDFVLKR